MGWGGGVVDKVNVFKCSSVPTLLTRIVAIMFTTNSCVKHRILHVLRDADAISREINADVLIADVIRKCNF